MLGAAGSPWPVPSPLGFTAPNTTLPSSPIATPASSASMSMPLRREELLEQEESDLWVHRRAICRRHSAHDGDDVGNLRQ